MKTFNRFLPRCAKGFCCCYSRTAELCMLLKIAVKDDRTEDSTARFEPISVFDVCLLFLTWIESSLKIKPESPVFHCHLLLFWRRMFWLNQIAKAESRRTSQMNNGGRTSNVSTNAHFSLYLLRSAVFLLAMSMTDSFSQNKIKWNWFCSKSNHWEVFLG